MERIHNSYISNALKLAFARKYNKHISEVTKEFIGTLKEIDLSENNIKDKKIRVLLTINNGFCKNVDLYCKNNRVKKAKITIYDMSLRVGQNETVVDDDPEIVLSDTILIEDKMENQIIPIEFSLKKNHTTTTPEIILKFEILEVYKGSLYEDTAISELKVIGSYIEN